MSGAGAGVGPAAASTAAAAAGAGAAAGPPVVAIAITELPPRGVWAAMRFIPVRVNPSAALGAVSLGSTVTARVPAGVRAEDVVDPTLPPEDGWVVKVQTAYGIAASEDNAIFIYNRDRSLRGFIHRAENDHFVDVYNAVRARARSFLRAVTGRVVWRR